VRVRGVRVGWWGARWPGFFLLSSLLWSLLVVGYCYCWAMGNNGRWEHGSRSTHDGARSRRGSRPRSARRASSHSPIARARWAVGPPAGGVRNRSLWPRPAKRPASHRAGASWSSLVAMSSSPPTPTHDPRPPSPRAMALHSPCAAGGCGWTSLVSPPTRNDLQPLSARHYLQPVKHRCIQFRQHPQFCSDSRIKLRLQ
jgi:hypothetical protein